MEFRFCRWKRQRIWDRLLDAERHPPPPVEIDEGELMELLPVGLGEPSALSAVDERKFRRILAMLHYGDEDEDLSGRELLTQGERDYLDAYVISEHWAAFRAQHFASGWKPHH